MKKLTKFMSVLLSLMLTLSMFAMSASAADVEYVDYAEILVDTDIAGVDADDYYDYITILSPELQFEDDYDEPAVYVECSDGEYLEGEFEEGETYLVSLFLSCNAGYSFYPEDKYGERYFDALINRVEPVYCRVDFMNRYGDDYFHGADIVECVELKFYITIGEGLGYKVIDKIDIDIDIKPGTLVGDYYDYITINTDNIYHDDEFGYQTVYAYYDDDHEDSLDDDTAYEAGKVYDLDLYFGAGEGYYISDYADVYINGELFEGYYNAAFDYDAEGEFEYSYLNIELYDYLVEGSEEEFTFWQKIVNFFTNIFDSIANFFGGLFAEKLSF